MGLLQFSARKKAVLISVGVILLVGLGFVGWQIKSGKLFSRANTESPFSDVPSNYWAFNQIVAAKNAGVIYGYPDGTFRPEEVVTRDQGAVFIARAAAGGESNVPNYTGNPHCDDGHGYNDVPPTQWAYKYIEYLFVHNIVLREDNPLGRCLFKSDHSWYGYKPANLFLRGDMAVYLARAKAGGDSQVPAGPATPSFNDIPVTSIYYKYVEYGKAQGIFQGYPDGTYRPADTVTRAQLAVYMVNYLGLLPPPSPTPPTPSSPPPSSPISPPQIDYQPANISGQVTDSSGAPLANGYIVIDEGEDIVQADANGNYTLSGLDATTYEVGIYDQDGNQYESPDIGNHLISPNIGDNTINFSGLVQIPFSTMSGANISGRVTDSLGNPLANGYLVLDSGEIAGNVNVIQLDDNGNYSETDLKITAYIVEIYDQDGNGYTMPNNADDIQMIELSSGDNQINFPGLIRTPQTD